MKIVICGLMRSVYALPNLEFYQEEILAMEPEVIDGNLEKIR